MEATAHLQFAKHHLKNSESMRAKILWSGDLQLNSLGRAPSPMSEHQSPLTICVVKHGGDIVVVVGFSAAEIGKLTRIEMTKIQGA